jgi:hypothetical protein
MPDRRRIEPWPIAVVALLALMIGICGALWAVAASHVDPEVERVVADPGPVAAPGEAR